MRQADPFCREYDQARRAYLFALKCDPTSDQTLRELVQLQVHLRDYPGFEETSRKVLMQKPSVIQNWVTMAIACCTNRNYSGCLQAIESVIKFQDEQGSKSRLKPHELSEVILLALRALERQNKHAEALAFFTKHEAKIVDLQAKYDVHGRIQHKLGNEVAAVANFDKLLELNSSNLNTFRKVIEAKGVILPANPNEKMSEAYQNILKGILEDYAQTFPRTNTPLRIGLRYLWGDTFRDFLDRFMRPMLIKGVPSLLMDLRELYSSPEKVAIIEAHLKGMSESMEQEMTLRPGDDDEQDPTVLLWLYYFLAQNFLFKNELTNALSFVNKAIEHTPTLLELYTLKAKIYQKLGDRKKAAALHEEARCLDTADRAINAISALYTLKTGDVERGVKIMDIFVKDCGYDVSIHDNQTMWFEQMTGRGHYLSNNFKDALKQFRYVQLHAEHMVQDQIDYYQYSIRRFTLKSFEDLLAFADKRMI